MILYSSSSSYRCCCCCRSCGGGASSLLFSSLLLKWDSTQRNSIPPPPLLFPHYLLFTPFSVFVPLFFSSLLIQHLLTWNLLLMSVRYVPLAAAVAAAAASLIRRAGIYASLLPLLLQATQQRTETSAITSAHCTPATTQRKVNDIKDNGTNKQTIWNEEGEGGGGRYTRVATRANDTWNVLLFSFEISPPFNIIIIIIIVMLLLL